MLAIVALVPIAVGIFVFTNCLKRRKEKRKMKWRCRKATRRCRCCFSCPRTYAAHLERQKQKNILAKTKSFDLKSSKVVPVGEVSDIENNRDEQSINQISQSVSQTTLVTIPNNNPS